MTEPRPMADENVWERDEVLRRFCAVGNEAQRHLGYTHAADCFCGGNISSVIGAGGPFRYSEAVLAFVESAVHEAVKAARGFTEKDIAPHE